MRKLSFYLILFIPFISSCKKEEVEPDSNAGIPMPEQPLPNYTPMTVGDYWVYENFQVDTLGNDSSIGIIDSVYIANDTLINGETYYVFRGSNYPITPNPNEILEIVQNKNGDLVNSQGSISFSSVNFTDTLSSYYSINNGDTLFFRYLKMDNQLTSFSVPHGTFNALKANLTIESFHGLSPINPRVLPSIYGENIGLISSSIAYISSSSHFERRLIRASVTN